MRIDHLPMRTVTPLEASETNTEADDSSLSVLVAHFLKNEYTDMAVGLICVADVSVRAAAGRLE